MQRFANTRAKVRTSDGIRVNRLTYGKGDLGATDIVGGDIEVTSDLPLLLDGLVLGSSADADLDTTLVVGLVLGIEGKLVVSEGPGGGSAALVLNLELVRGLVDVRTAAVLLSLGLELPLSVESLSTKTDMR